MPDTFISQATNRPTINKLNCPSAVSVNSEIENGRSQNVFDRRLAF